MQGRKKLLQWDCENYLHLQGFSKRSPSFIRRVNKARKKRDVRKWDDQEWHDRTVDQKMFYPEASLFSGGVVCWLKLGGWVGEAKFRDLGEGEKLNQSAFCSD